MNYYISDLHFGHQNVIQFDSRPFADAEQMAAALIENWNQRVTGEDTVYVLGDAFWKNEEGSVQIIQRLMNDNSSADVLNEIFRKLELHPLSTFSFPHVRHFSFMHPQSKHKAHSIPEAAGKEISR